jgi:exodeoxyribonuclease III
MLPFPIKLATWNVNGLRSRSAQLLEWMQAEQPDIVCLQEIRATQEQIPMDLCDLPGYHCRWHGGGKGYSGVALHLSTRLGDPKFIHPAFDMENRIVGAEIGNLVLYSVYIPNGGKDFQAKMDFFGRLSEHLGELAGQGRDVLLAGDLNVTRSSLDVHPKELKSKPVVGQLPPERVLFEEMLAKGYVDVQRTLHPEDDSIFTWWAPWRNLRQRNIGWRIDYVLASTELAKRATSCVSQREVGTSDHAPVVALFA